MKKIIFPVILIMVILALFFSSVVIVQEGEKGVVLRFNKIEALVDPGLHFKIPFIDKVRLIDAKIQTTNSSNLGSEQNFITREKKGLIVDYYVQWKITNFERYYETVAGGTQVEDLLLARLNGRLRAEIGKLDIKDIINDTNADVNSRNSLMLKVTNELNGNVHGISDQEIERASMKNFGVEVVDVRIKQINFPKDVSESIYSRMRTEREVVARDQRFQGKRQAEEIRAQAMLSATKTISEAEKTARIIRGEGDANVAKLYAQAFKQDEGFFSFMRSLKAYEKSFNPNDTLVIKPNSPFLRYMQLTVQ